MAIYTKTGDRGETSLASGRRVPKTDGRIEAYGTIDELNSVIGWLRYEITQNEMLCTPKEGELSVEKQIEWIQHKLFDLGAWLSEAGGEWIHEEDVQAIEHWIDGIQVQVPRQRAFLIPYGNEVVSRCHICRTICRRAERRMVEIGVQGTELGFVNRLSDYLFVLSRYVAHRSGVGDATWRQGLNVEKLTEL